VAHKDLAEHTIKLTVYDVTRQRHVVIGHAVYPLTNHMFDDRIIVWRDLERELIQVGILSRLMSVTYIDCRKRHRHPPSN